MTIQELLDKITEIKRLANDTIGQGESDKENIKRIVRICEDIEIEKKVEERLKV